MDGVGGLDPDTSVAPSLGGYGEWNISHGVENGNDITDRVETTKDRSLLVIGVRYHIGRAHIVEHDRLGRKGSDGSVTGIFELVRVNPFKCTLRRWTLDEKGVMNGLLITKKRGYLVSRRQS